MTIPSAPWMLPPPLRRSPRSRRTPGDLDGVNLIPHLTGEVDDTATRRIDVALDSPVGDSRGKVETAARWRPRVPVRSGCGLGREAQPGVAVSRDSDSPPQATRRMGSDSSTHPDSLPAGCQRLPQATLTSIWTANLRRRYARNFVPRHHSVTKRPTFRGWLARNGELSVQDEALRLTVVATKEPKAPFLAHSRLNVPGPVTASLQLKTSTSGKVSIAWRTSTQKDFEPECQVDFDVAASERMANTHHQLPRGRQADSFAGQNAVRHDVDSRVHTQVSVQQTDSSSGSCSAITFPGMTNS